MTEDRGVSDVSEGDGVVLTYQSVRSGSEQSVEGEVSDVSSVSVTVQGWDNVWTLDVRERYESYGYVKKDGRKVGEDGVVECVADRDVNPNWCGRDECPACQGYDEGPPGTPDCPWLGEDIPSGEREVADQ